MPRRPDGWYDVWYWNENDGDRLTPGRYRLEQLPQWIQLKHATIMKEFCPQQVRQRLKPEPQVTVSKSKGQLRVEIEYRFKEGMVR